MGLEELRFLVADDMKTVRLTIIQQLNNLGVSNIDEAEDGVAALSILKDAASSKNPVQFVISDWNMPEMTGLALLHACRELPEYKEVAFLMITSESEARQVMAALNSGVDNYVVKPFTSEQLKEKLELVYKKRFR